MQAFFLGKSPEKSHHRRPRLAPSKAMTLLLSACLIGTKQINVDTRRNDSHRSIEIARSIRKSRRHRLPKRYPPRRSVHALALDPVEGRRIVLAQILKGRPDQRRLAPRGARDLTT